MSKIQANGTDLYFTACGSGRPMLLMHGGLGHDHTYFRPRLDALADSVIEITGTTVNHFRDGKIVRGFQQLDMSGLRRQLG